MFNRQLVLVAIDHATDVERTMDVALSTAKARAADVRRNPGGAPQRQCMSTIVPIYGLSSLTTVAVSTSERGSHRFRDRPTMMECAFERVTLRGEPEHVIPAYAQLHEATMLVVERDYGSSRFWRNGRVVDEMARRSPIPLLVLPKRQTT